MIEAVLSNMITEWSKNNYQPLLEADVSGWLFHYAVIKHGLIKTNEELHLETRIINQPRYRYDFVVGGIQRPKGKRICISPRIAMEIKLFPKEGFAAPQHGVHFDHILKDDLPKLSLVANKNCTCYELVVDGANYLSGSYKNRKDTIINNRKNKNIILLFLEYINERWLIDRK
ncbi:hypothetical protein FACS189461_3400 [Spirochaetia bacterium]|nr:hypothetical protein FACS189461_3400 [Spirochaetia bacterium]